MENELKALQTQGQQLYRQGKYQEALDYFNSVCNAPPNPQSHANVH